MLRTIPIVLIGAPVPGLFNTYLALPARHIEIQVSVRKGRECRVEIEGLGDELKSLVQGFIETMCGIEGEPLEVVAALRGDLRRAPTLSIYIALTNAIAIRVLKRYGHGLAKYVPWIVEYIDGSVIESADPGMLTALRCADALLRPCVARGVEFVESRTPCIEDIEYEVLETRRADYSIVNELSKEVLALILKLESMLVKEAIESLSSCSLEKLMKVVSLASAIESKLLGLDVSGRVMPTHRAGLVEVGRFWVGRGRLSR